MESTNLNTAEAKERVYQNAQLLMEGRLYSEAADQFSLIPDYKDAAKKKEVCEQMKLREHLDRIYDEAAKAAENMNVRSQEKAIRIFETIPGYRDADARIDEAKRNIGEIVLKEKADREAAIEEAKLEEVKAKERKRRRFRTVGAVALGLALLVLGAFLFQTFAVPALRYQKGIKQMQAGDLDGAYKTLHGMNYQNSGDLICLIERERLKDAEIGSTVLFGSYAQGRITSSESTPIEWQVIDRDGTKLMLISKYALDALPYMKFSFYEEHTPVSWRTSMVREWLNDTFLNAAFDNGEKSMLERTGLRSVSSEEASGLSAVEQLLVMKYQDADKNSAVSSGIMDRVFLLSSDEVMKYFPNAEDRLCLATSHALGYGAYRSSVGCTCLWWLRTPSYGETDPCGICGCDISADTGYTERVVCIGTSGQIVDVGHLILNTYGLRPVIWVDTAAGEENA